MTGSKHHVGMHIPLPRPYFRMNGVGDDPVVWTRCACGYVGEPAHITRGEDPQLKLTEQHSCPEPPGCALCGFVAPMYPPRAVTRAEHRNRPWHRYSVVELEGVWSYVCRQGHECRQRQLAASAAGPLPVEPVDPIAWIDPRRDHMEVSFDVSYESFARDCDLDSAITLLLMARGRAPRAWPSVTAMPGDRRALLAAVTAAAALKEAAAKARVIYMLAARKAGASWDELVAAGWYAADGGRTRDKDQLRSWLTDRIQEFEWLNEDVEDPAGPDVWHELQRLLHSDDGPGAV